MRTSAFFALVLSAILLLGALSLSWDRIVDGPFPWWDGASATPDKCDVPITFQIGEINPEFGLTSNELGALVREAADMWEAASDDVLFIHDPDGDLVINMIYEDRQITWDRQTTARRAVNAARDQHRRLYREHLQEERAFETAQEKFEESASEVEEHIQSYNERIDRLNEGEVTFTEEEATALEEGVRSLQEKQQNVEEMRRELAEKQDRLNELASRVNESGRETERLISAYNRQFGSMEGFNKAIYFRQGGVRFIHVYQFDGTDDLLRVLAHELGHALGIAHIDDPSAIMYHEVTEYTAGLVGLSEADHEALRDVCGRDDYEGQ